jgi:predicted outer membrane repeat protein
VQVDVTLNSALPQITSLVTINGNGHTITRNRAFQTGGGIYSVAGSVTVNISTIANNVADERGGGIANYGTATVFNSTIANPITFLKPAAATANSPSSARRSAASR